jgi:transposase
MSANSSRLFQVKEDLMRVAPAIDLTPQEWTALEAWVSAPETPLRHALRGRIILAAACGRCNMDIAAELQVSQKSVSLWRRRFAAGRQAGIATDAPRSGRPPVIAREKLVETLGRSLTERRAGGLQWSTRAMARASGLGKSTIQRVWRSAGISPSSALAGQPVSNPLKFVQGLQDQADRYRDSRAPQQASEPTDSPAYSKEHLARATHVHSILEAFLAMTFQDFDRLLLDGGERTLKSWEQIAAAYQQYEIGRGRLAGDEANIVGRSLSRISSRLPNEPALVSRAVWNRLVRIYESNPPLQLSTIDVTSDAVGSQDLGGRSDPG